MNKTEQEFLKALDDKLWKAACKLQSSLDAANYYLDWADLGYEL